MNSAFYVGRLAHARMTPKPHRFSYRVFMPFIDVDRLSDITQVAMGWGSRRFTPARFIRNDFIGDENLSVADAVKERIFEETNQHFEGRIFLLANWRYFGLQNNPIACYFCEGKTSERLEFIVVEVTNTPWRERHSYVLPVGHSAALFQAEFQKELHVSPFHGMQQQYRWSSTVPDETLAIKLTNLEDGERIFHASLTLSRIPISRLTGLSLLARFPFETAKVTAGIYWQALVLFLRRVPLFAHPKNNPVN